MTRLRAWFHGRSHREKWMLIVMVGLIALAILVWGIIVPVEDGLSSAKARHQDAVIRLGEVQADVAALRSLTRVRPAPLPVPLEGAIRDRANGAQLPITSLTVISQDRVTVRMVSVSSAALLGWIADLEGVGVIVDRINILNNPDQTVTADMTLRTIG